MPDYFDFDDSYNEIMSVFYACTSEDPKSRPSAKQIVEILKNYEKDECSDSDKLF